MPMILASGRIGAADGASSSRSPLALFDGDRWVPAQARRENVPAGEMSRRELGRRTAEGMRSRVSRISPVSSLPYHARTCPTLSRVRCRPLQHSRDPADDLPQQGFVASRAPVLSGSTRIVAVSLA